MKPELGWHLSKPINYRHLRLLCGCALLIIFTASIISVWVASIAVHLYPAIVSDEIDIGYVLYTYTSFVNNNIFSREPTVRALAWFLALFSYPWQELSPLIFALGLFLPVSVLSSVGALVLIGYGFIEETAGLSSEVVRRRILPGILYVLIVIGIVPTIVVFIIYEIELITVWFVGFFSAVALLGVGAVGLPFPLAVVLWKLRQG